MKIFCVDGLGGDDSLRTLCEDLGGSYLPWEGAADVLLKEVTEEAIVVGFSLGGNQSYMFADESHVPVHLVLIEPVQGWAQIVMQHYSHAPKAAKSILVVQRRFRLTPPFSSDVQGIKSVLVDSSHAEAPNAAEDLVKQWVKNVIDFNGELL